MPSPCPAHQAARARIGAVVDGRWRLDALVAVGGCSAIYAATHRNGHRVAMKIFDGDLSSNATAVAHFLREGRIANRIGHPGVVEVVDEGTTADGTPFLLMPLLEGQTAQQRLACTPDGLPTGEALAIVEAVLDVLVAAHDRGIVHRDLKPENVFLERTGGVRVLDFGIARALDNPDATAHGTVMGTPGYMAPEQACGRLEDVDARTDLWSVGALLFTLLTGRVLHDAPNPLASVVRAQSEPVPRARELVSGASEAVAEILDGALAFEASQRWMDATTMRWAVRAALHATRAGRESSGSCAGLAVDALAMPSDAPVALAPGSTRITWRPVPWITAACVAAVLGFVGTAAYLRGVPAPTAAAAPRPVMVVAGPAVPHPLAPPPAIDVDDLPHASPAPSAHPAPRTRPQAQEIVRKLEL
jgi:eukaryotic-like serine/threonine-protein kinase